MIRIELQYGGGLGYSAIFILIYVLTIIYQKKINIKIKFKREAINKI